MAGKEELFQNLLCVYYGGKKTQRHDRHIFLSCPTDLSNNLML